MLHNINLNSKQIMLKFHSVSDELPSKSSFSSYLCGLQLSIFTFASTSTSLCISRYQFGSAIVIILLPSCYFSRLSISRAWLVLSLVDIERVISSSTATQLSYFYLVGTVSSNGWWRELIMPFVVENPLIHDRAIVQSGSYDCHAFGSPQLAPINSDHEGCFDSGWH